MKIVEIRTTYARVTQIVVEDTQLILMAKILEDSPEVEKFRVLECTRDLAPRFSTKWVDSLENPS